MKQWRIFCADCKQEYEQEHKYVEYFKPVRCGFCGSYWIAVKEIVPVEEETIDEG